MGDLSPAAARSPEATTGLRDGIYSEIPGARAHDLLFGLRGHLFRADDRGQSWKARETGTEAMLTDGLRLADGTILITGLGGTLLVSHDDGRSFTLQQEPDRLRISSVVETDRGTVIETGEFGVRGRLKQTCLG